MNGWTDVMTLYTCGRLGIYVNWLAHMVYRLYGFEAASSVSTSVAGS